MLSCYKQISPFPLSATLGEQPFGLHPQVIEASQPLLDGWLDNELLFRRDFFWMWIRQQKIPMSRFKGHFVLGDFRKAPDTTPIQRALQAELESRYRINQFVLNQNIRVDLPKSPCGLSTDDNRGTPSLNE